MTKITAADVAKLRKMTGAGMMDCKKALQEAEGDFEKAVEIIRKKGQAVANKRADREATEGVVLARVNENGDHGAMIVLNCETDFVAKNESFVAFANEILSKALDENPDNLDSLKELKLKNTSIQEAVVEQIGIIGEKLDLAFYEKITAPTVAAYVHPGNKLASMVGLNRKNIDKQVVRDVAMQIAAMNPIAIDKDDVPQDVIDKEIEIGKEQARRENKPENLLERIALGKLNKFFKEGTLLNQEFVKDNKKTIRQYLQETDKELTVTAFKRYTLNV